MFHCIFTLEKLFSKIANFVLIKLSVIEEFLTLATRQQSNQSNKSKNVFSASIIGTHGDTNEERVTSQCTKCVFFLSKGFRENLIVYNQIIMRK